MALYIRKRRSTNEDCDDVFERQAETLDDLLSGKVMGTSCLDELVCSEDDFIRAESDTDEEENKEGDNRQEAKKGEKPGRVENHNTFLT